MYQKNKRKTAPGLNSLGLENRPDLQKAHRGHVMTFKMPMEEIRKKYIEDNIVQGPSNLADIKSTFKYVIMHPTGTKEEAEEIASKLPIRHARKHVVKALLRYYFTYHQPRLYPRNNPNLTIQKCISEMKENENPCGILVAIHKEHPDAEAATEDGKGEDTQATEVATEDGKGENSKATEKIEGTTGEPESGTGATEKSGCQRITNSFKLFFLFWVLMFIGIY